MKLFHLLLISEAIAARMVLYQPQDFVSVDVGATAVLSCMSNEAMEIGDMMFWFRKDYKPAESPIRVKACNNKTDVHKYGCTGNSKNMINLEIYNIQISDSGIYYCSMHYVNQQKYSNGTMLIVRDNSTLNSSIYLLTTLNATNQLACVVNTPLHTVYMLLAVTGTQHKSRMISSKIFGGNWFFQDLLLPRNLEDYGNHVTCEVWLCSSTVHIHWTKKEIDTSKDFTMACKIFLGFVFLLPFGLVGHLIWTYKQRDKQTQDANCQDTSDGIVYAHLNMNQLNQRRM
ncbi:uncharacterized protein [Pyxicephalus adspersus]|uniref:uncharacterized protein n=1 Tax=Pyxicephalus adspersus TaxID=30357 RepID=UPI003B5C5530